MRQLLSILLLFLFASPAQADPVSLSTAVTELREMGAVHIERAIIFGEPRLTASIEGEGMSLSMFQCAGEEYFCDTTVFRTCRSFAGLNKAGALDIINSYNADAKSRGTGFVGKVLDDGLPLCVRLRRDLHRQDQFDFTDTFDWQMTMRDFYNHVDRRTKILVAAGLSTNME